VNYLEHHPVQKRARFVPSFRCNSQGHWLGAVIIAYRLCKADRGAEAQVSHTSWLHDVSRFRLPR